MTKNHDTCVPTCFVLYFVSGSLSPRKWQDVGLNALAVTDNTPAAAAHSNHRRLSQRGVRATPSATREHVTWPLMVLPPQQPGTNGGFIHSGDPQDEAAEALLPAAVRDSSSFSQHRGHTGDSASANFSVTLTQPDDGGSKGGQAVTSGSTGSATGWPAVLCLCGTHALARWGWRTWEFAVALILIKLFPTSLLLVSIFGLLDNIVRLVFGSVIGQFVDRCVLCDMCF